MAPTNHKKARVQAPTPLGSLLPAGSARKDESELELEEAVFGRGRGARASVWDTVAEDDALEAEQYGEDVETGLERLTDESLFFVDSATGSTSTVPGLTIDSDSDSSSENEGARRPMASTSVLKSTSLRRAAWHDPADEDLTVSLKDVARLRKLRLDPGENVVGGLEYEGRLRRQFEKMHPAPSWVTDARKRVMRKRVRARDRAGLDPEEDSEGEDEVDNLFRTVGARNGSKASRRGALKAGDIDIDRARDANQAEESASNVVAVEFHPRAQVLFSATADRRLRLFQIDGTDNPLLQTLHVPELPITSAAYHPSGSSILLTGARPFFISYDLQSGTVLRSPRGLLTGGLGGSDRASTGGMGGMEQFKFSPDGGMLAVGGRRGYVHLVDWGAAGVGNGGQVVGQVKMNVAVKGIAWQRDGRELLTLGEDSEVYVWDVGMRKCVMRWKDEGGFGACGIETSQEGYTAIASTTGIVNLYESDSAQGLVQGAERPTLKSIGNLTTAVTSMRFSRDAQILALASRATKDQLKLVHLPSATVFANWPTQATPLHHVTTVDFSKGSEFLAIGNAKGKVLLYALKHFGRL